MPTHYTEIRRTYDSPYRAAAADATTGGFKATPRSQLTVLVKLAADTRAGLKSATDEMLSDFSADPDDSTHLVVAVDGNRIGNALALLQPVFIHQDVPDLGAISIGPPIAYGATNIRTVWLPTVKGGGGYGSDPDVAVFAGAIQHRKFKLLEAVIRVAADSTDTLDLSGGAGAGNVNNAAWNGLAANHVYYAGMANFTGYDPPGDDNYWRRWHVYVYRRWMKPAPDGVNPHDEVYVDEDGKIQIDIAGIAAIYNPFA